MKYLLILLCGGAGSLARYLASTTIASRFGARFPVAGTMAVNISGCFVIGLVMTLLTERLQPHPYWRLALVVGFLGGYTTFSAFSLQMLDMLMEGDLALALLYVFFSIVISLISVAMGYVIAGFFY